MQPWHRVAVLPFSGEPEFRRPIAEWFTHLISKHNLFETIVPAVAEIELGKKGLRIGDADIPLTTAQEAGRMLGVDGVIVGIIKASGTEQAPSARSMSLLKKAVGVSIVDVATGKVVATGALSDVLIVTSTSNATVSTVELLVNDLLPGLYAVAGMTWTPPKPKGGFEQESGGRL